jgi:hypothetical protein
VPSILAAEGGYQVFELKGGEWAVLLLSVAAALLAIAVGFYLVKVVMAADAGSPKMQEIAKAIQEGAWAYLKRQFRTIAVILIPLAAIVFVTSTAIKKPDGTEALGFAAAGTWRTVAFVLGCLASGLTGYIGMTLATRGNVRTAAAALSGSMPKALTVAFRTGGIAGMFTVGLGLLGATLIIMIFQNSSSVILVGFGFGGSLLRCSSVSAVASSPRPPTSAPTWWARSKRASPRTTRVTRPPSPTTWATTWATAPAWLPTCSRATRSPWSPRSSWVWPPSTRSASTRPWASCSRWPHAPSV